MEFTKYVNGNMSFYYAWDNEAQKGFEAFSWETKGYVNTMNEPPRYTGEPIDMMEFYKGCVTAQNIMLGTVRSFIIPQLISTSTEDRTRSPDA